MFDCSYIVLSSPSVWMRCSTLSGGLRYPAVCFPIEKKSQIIFLITTITAFLLRILLTILLSLWKNSVFICFLWPEMSRNYKQMLNFTRRTLIGWCTVCNERKSQINFLIATLVKFSCFSCQNSDHMYEWDAQLCQEDFDSPLCVFLFRENLK